VGTTQITRYLVHRKREVTRRSALPKTPTPQGPVNCHEDLQPWVTRSQLQELDSTKYRILYSVPQRGKQKWASVVASVMAAAKGGRL
jgi:hypothetical protein